MIYVIEHMENGKWVYLRLPNGMPMMFSRKQDADAKARRLGPTFRVIPIKD